MAPLARRWHRWHVVGTSLAPLAGRWHVFFFPDVSSKCYQEALNLAIYKPSKGPYPFRTQKGQRVTPLYQLL
jgi:hypothetical protein